MAYSDQNWLVTIRGNLAGGEVWANTYALSGPGDIQDGVDALHTWYEVWAGVCADVWEAVSASVRNLGDAITLGADWALITGQNTTDNPLPTECAIRLTVDTPNRSGGPFLCGVASDALDAEGSMSSTSLTGVLAGLDDLVNTDLPAAGLPLGLNSPTEEEVFFATRVRIGHIFDVIRRRRNRLSEAYDVVVIT